METNDQIPQLMETVETVNPADLYLPFDEQLIDQIPLTDTPIEPSVLPTEPIWINNTQPASYTPQEERPQSYWEPLSSSLDLNYSSYGSSPADNALGYQLLVQRFGHYNLGMSRGNSFEKPPFSRNPSISSFEQYPQSPNTETWPRRSQPRARRGRLLADMSGEGPETVFEDSDSHHSWTASDNLESWCTQLRERLTEFRRNKQRVSIITSPLQTRQRRKVHSMANLWGLSHMSIGSAREKRVLICKSELTKSYVQSAEKRWNPTRSNWAPGLVDPRIVLFDLISPKLTAERFRGCLQEAGLPVPTRVTIEYFNPMHIGMLNPVATAYAMFESADEATIALLELDGTKPNWNGLDVELECDYVHFPPGFELNDALLGNFDALPEAVRTERYRMQEGRGVTRFRSRTSVIYSDSESEEDLVDSSGGPSMTSSRTHGPRKTSTESWHSTSRDPGYASAGSNYSSQTSTSRKRRRVPKITGGYNCTFQGCDRVFDRDGDRRKHEKNHASDRPHVCKKCGKGFLFPKDLRRHMIVHSITSLPSSNEGDGVEEPESPDLVSQTPKVSRLQRKSNSGTGVPERVAENAKVMSTSPPLSEDHLKRLYGQARHLDKRISRISSFS